MRCLSEYFFPPMGSFGDAACLRRRVSGSTPIFSASSSMADSSANVPSTYPGARKAESEPAFVTTLYDFDDRFAMSYSVFVGPVGFATHLPWPTLAHDMCSSAVMRPP